jgi:ABC-type multidrug transport system ATPase subunit
MEEIVAAARAAEADRFISKLIDGYDTVVGERGYTLSGGERQRIVIARTLLVNPPVLIFDEATSAIDVQVELQIHAAFRRLMQGRTTIIIAHRLSAIGLANRVVLIDGGRIVAQGSHDELLATEPLYGEILAQAELEEGALGDGGLKERVLEDRGLQEGGLEDGGHGDGGHGDDEHGDGGLPNRVLEDRVLEGREIEDRVLGDTVLEDGGLEDGGPKTGGFD